MTKENYQNSPKRVENQVRPHRATADSVGDVVFVDYKGFTYIVHPQPSGEYFVHRRGMAGRFATVQPEYGLEDVVNWIENNT